MRSIGLVFYIRMETYRGKSFSPADDLWESFQTTLSEFVNFNGANAQVLNPTKERPDWEKVQGVMEGNKPITNLGCN